MILGLAATLPALTGCLRTIAAASDEPPPAALAEAHPVDWQEALTYAERSAAAYLTAPEIQALYEGQPVVVEDLPSIEVQYFVLFDDAGKQQHVAVRGTANFANAALDAEYIPEADPRLGVRLHRGFGKAAPELFDHVKPKLREGYAVTVTGHSLGGALAAILGRYLQRDGFGVRKVVTFGQPKVTNTAGADEFAPLPITRFVHKNDPVPDVPPLMVAHDDNWRYTHFGPEVILWTGARYIYLEQHQTVALAVLSFWRDITDHSVDDHSMDAYVEAIRQRMETGAQEIPFTDRNRYLDEPPADTVTPAAEPTRT
jgi:hypothetical protein